MEWIILQWLKWMTVSITMFMKQVMAKSFSWDVFLTIINISMTHVFQTSLFLYLQHLYTLTHKVHQLEKTCYKTKQHIPKEQKIIMWQSCHRYLAKVLFCFHFFNSFLIQRNCYHIAVLRVYTSIWKGKKGYQISG